MELTHAVFVYLCFLSVLYAVKEDASYGSSQATAKHLIQMIKRLGRQKGVNFDDLLDEKDSGELCKTNKLTRNNIIKSSDSIAAGAKFVSSHNGVSSIDECSNLCCDDSNCDTSIYQDNKEQHCYLFVCLDRCKFTVHADYSVTTIERFSPPPQPPAQPKHEEETQLENLHDNNNVNDGAAPQQPPAEHQDAHAHDVQQPVTSVPTSAPKSYVAPHTADLSSFCTSDVSCEDPNAGCSNQRCDCKQGYYNKSGICRKVCPKYVFECEKLGSLTRGPECIPESQVCDSYLHCADGSDEYGCMDLSEPAGNAAPSSWNQQSPSWSAGAGSANYNRNSNVNVDQSLNQRQPVSSGNQRPSNLPQAAESANLAGNNGQRVKQSNVQPGNVQFPDMNPTVRANVLPAQHAASSMNGNGNNYPNTNTNNQPSHFPKPLENNNNNNNRKANANANPLINPSPSSVYDENGAHQGQSSRLNSQVSGNPAVVPNQMLNNKEANNRPPPQHEVPQQSSDERHMQANSNRAYVEGGPPKGIPVSGPQSQGRQFLSSQKQVSYPQQSLSRAVNRTMGSADGVRSQITDEKNPKQRAESHYLSKPSAPTSLTPSSALSSQFRSRGKAQTEAQRTNGHQGHQQPSSLANKGPMLSRLQTEDRPSHYKSIPSSSSSSHSNRADQPSWLDRDAYMPYGSANQKLPSQARQRPQSQYYGQQSQYYRPYSSDSLNSLPSSLLQNSGSQDDFSQFGGPYLEPQKPPSQLQYQLNGGNSGYMNYPDSSYSSQFSPQNKYNFGGDLSSSNYQDPDFYLPLGNPPAYHPDGLYEDNPASDASNSDNLRKNKDDNNDNEGAMPHTVNSGPAQSVPVKKPLPSKEVPDQTTKKPKTPAPVIHAAKSTPVPKPTTKLPVATHTAKVNPTEQATSKPRHHSVGTKEEVYLSREKVIIASSTSEAEGPIIALTLGLAFTIILIGLLACRLRNMKHRLRKGRPLNSNEADYLINGMYL